MIDIAQERIVRVSNSLGVHARPAGKISQEAQRFSADIIITSQDGEADAKSILDILTLAAPRGTELLIKASGPDAPQAIETIVRLFEDKFGEDR